MKIRLVVALTGLAISLALPTSAQQTNSPDPQLRQVAEALSKKFDDAWNNNDASTLAALFTKDAVLVNNTGPIYGRDAIEKMYADLFQKVHFSNHVAKPDPYSPHIIGTTGNEM
jgi:SnoaL-like domain